MGIGEGNDMTEKYHTYVSLHNIIDRAIGFHAYSFLIIIYTIMYSYIIEHYKRYFNHVKAVIFFEKIVP